jgi:hypothetical protein
MPLTAVLAPMASENIATQIKIIFVRSRSIV